MVLIRLANEEDAREIAQVYRPYVEGSRISFEELAPDAAEMERRIIGERPASTRGRSRTKAAGSSASPAARRSGSDPPIAGASRPASNLAPDACGRGLGKSLLVALTDLLKSQGYVTAIGAIALPNEPSVRLHEALGFKHSGTYHGTGFKMGTWIDVGLWQKELAPRLPSPAEPMPFEGLFSPAA